MVTEMMERVSLRLIFLDESTYNYSIYFVYVLFITVIVTEYLCFLHLGM
jgi:hypothetical protein